MDLVTSSNSLTAGSGQAVGDDISLDRRAGEDQRCHARAGLQTLQVHTQLCI